MKNYKIVSKSRYNITFEAVSEQELDKTQIHEIMCKLGYNPKGYGDAKQVTNTIEGSDVVTRWSCSSSCD